MIAMINEENYTYIKINLVIYKNTD